MVSPTATKQIFFSRCFAIPRKCYKEIKAFRKLWNFRSRFPCRKNIFRESVDEWSKILLMFVENRSANFCWTLTHLSVVYFTHRNSRQHKKMKFSIKNFFSKSCQIHSFLRIWSHLLNKSSIKNFIFVSAID